MSEQHRALGGARLRAAVSGAHPGRPAGREIGAEGSPGWLRIEGQIGADGKALLDARGRTGDPEFAVNQPPPSSPYGYRIDARFEGGHGTGRRLEQRVCNFEFVRR